MQEQATDTQAADAPATGSTGRLDALHGHDAPAASGMGSAPGGAAAPGTGSIPTPDSGALSIRIGKPDSTREGESVFVTTPALEQQRQSMQTSSYAESSFTWGGYFQAIGLLLFMLMLLWLGLRLLRRFGKGRFMPRNEPLSADDLYLEGNLPLGQNRSVCVVRFRDRQLVLGVTENQINYLTEMPAGDPSASALSGPASPAEEDEASDAEFTAFMEKLGREDKA